MVTFDITILNCIILHELGKRHRIFDWKISRKISLKIQQKIHHHLLKTTKIASKLEE